MRQLIKRNLFCKNTVTNHASIYFPPITYYDIDSIKKGMLSANKLITVNVFTLISERFKYSLEYYYDTSSCKLNKYSIHRRIVMFGTFMGPKPISWYTYSNMIKLILSLIDEYILQAQNSTGCKQISNEISQSKIFHHDQILKRKIHSSESNRLLQFWNICFGSSLLFNFIFNLNNILSFLLKRH